MKRTPTRRAPLVAKPQLVFEGLMAIGGQNVPLKVMRRPRTKHLKMSSSVTHMQLTVPMRTPVAEIQAFLNRHAQWVLDHMPKAPPPLPVPFETATLLHAGQWAPLTWALGDRPQMRADGAGWCIVLPARREAQWPTFVRKLLAQHWDLAIRQALGADLGPCVAALGKAPKGPVRIHAVKSLWGSLSSKDQVMLDVALAMAPPAVLRYVWIHELCHLRERNHSAKFWAWVSRFCPDWRDQKEWLRQHGGQIKAIAHTWLAA